MRSTSIVATGGLSRVAPRFWDPDWASPISGAKAEASKLETSLSDQVALMLSGKRVGSSMMRTSDSLRRPRCTALFLSSFLRMWPSPSASPGGF